MPSPSVLARGADPYDHPRALGAACDACPLGPNGLKCTPVPSEVRPGKPMVVAEAPAAEEEEQRRPLVGRSGRALMDLLRDAGRGREDVSLVNTIRCRPAADNNLKGFLRKLGKRNKRRKKAGKPLVLSPVAACRPCFLRDLAAASGFLLLGATALQAVGGPSLGDKTLSAMRGFPFSVVTDAAGETRIWLAPDAPPAGARPMVATYHTAFALRRLRWMEVIRRDVAKFFRHLEGRLAWVDPERVVLRTLAQVRAALDRLVQVRDRPIAYDVETGAPLGRPRGWGKEPLRADLRCLGIGSPDWACVIPFLSIDKRTRFWTAEEESVLRRWLTDFFARVPNIVGQNLPFDRAVLRQYGIVPPREAVDCLLAAHVTRWSELRHSLNFLQSFYLDCPKHKWDADPDSWKSDEDLWRYNALDCSTEAAVALRVADDVSAAEQWRVYEVDRRKGVICEAMHRLGLPVDLAEMARHDRRLVRKMAQTQRRSDALLEKTVDLGSPDQVRQYLFEELGLDPPVVDEKPLMTDGGEPSVKREAVEALLDRGLDERTEAFLYCLLDFKEAQKLRSFVDPKWVWMPGEEGPNVPRGPRIHGTFSAGVVPTGRLSHSEPNLSTAPLSLRSIFCAPVGKGFVYSDKSQVEARVMAWQARDRELIRAFVEKRDVHRLNAAHLFQKRYEDVTDEERQLAKVFVYACQYGARWEKVYRILTGYYDADGKRPFARIKPEHVKWLYDNWWSRHDPIRRHQRWIVDEWARKGYLTMPIHDRRRYFLDAQPFGGNPMGRAREQALNCGPQGGTAADVDDACFDIVTRIPWDFDLAVGLSMQWHDAVVVETHENLLDSHAQTVYEAMTSAMGEMPLPCDVKVGRRLLPRQLCEFYAKRALKAADAVVADEGCPECGAGLGSRHRAGCDERDFQAAEADAWGAVAGSALVGWKGVAA